MSEASISEKFLGDFFQKGAKTKKAQKQKKEKNNKQNIKQHEQLWKTKNFKN